MADSTDFGARPLRRAIEQHVEDPLSEEILRGNVKAGETLEITLDGTKLGFHVTSRKEEASSSEPATAA